jgi:hypothetical protein
MWAYILGRFLALLPKPWRDALFFSQYAQEARATALSGVAESTGALIVLGYGYMYAMTAWVDRGVENATTGKLGVVTDQVIASVALSV